MNALVFLILLTLPIRLAFAAFKVGLVVPATSEHIWTSQQFTVGAQLAASHFNQSTAADMELVTFLSDLDNDAQIASLSNQIVSEGIDVVIGGATSASADALRYVSEDWKTPTVVITPPDTPPRPEGSRNPYVVDLGLPEQTIQRDTVSRWIRCYAPAHVAILYNGDYPTYALFASVAAKATARKPSDVLIWSDRADQPEQTKELKKVIGKADGVVIAGAPWNIENWVETIALAGNKGPIYVGPVVSGFPEIKELSQYSQGPVFAAAPYWTDPSNEEQLAFVQNATEKLGWSQDVTMTPTALQAYDAIAIITEAASRGHFISEAESAPHWWHDLDVVMGIKGQLLQYDNATIAPPTELLRVDHDGTAVFSRSAQDCPR